MRDGREGHLYPEAVTFAERVPDRTIFVVHVPQLGVKLLPIGAPADRLKKWQPH
jgi:hypothetical protein